MNITPEGFIVIDITDEMLATATSKAEEMGVLRRSIRKGKGNLCGFLGEECVLQAFEGSISENTYHHDISFGDLTFEVKTKDRTKPPLPHYEASVASYNSTQQADYYIFVSLLRKGDKYTKGYVMGYIETAKYKSEAVFMPKGKFDPSNGYVVKADCFNVPYSKLESLANTET